MAHSTSGLIFTGRVHSICMLPWKIGLADAERRQEALSNQLSAIQDKARACRATTFEGVRAKLQATIDPGEIADFERTQKELPLDPAESAILSLWRDVHQVEG